MLNWLFGEDKDAKREKELEQGGKGIPSEYKWPGYNCPDDYGQDYNNNDKFNHP